MNVDTSGAPDEAVAVEHGGVVGDPAADEPDEDGDAAAGVLVLAVPGRLCASTSMTLNLRQRQRMNETSFEQPIELFLVSAPSNAFICLTAGFEPCFIS